MAVGIMTLLSIKNDAPIHTFWMNKIYSNMCSQSWNNQGIPSTSLNFSKWSTIFLNRLYGQLVAHSFRPNRWPPGFWGVISSQILWWFYIFYFPCYEKSAKNAVTLVESCFSWIDDHLSLQFTNPENQQDLLALVGLCGKQTSTEKPNRAKRKL